MNSNFALSSFLGRAGFHAMERLRSRQQPYIDLYGKIGDWEGVIARVYGFQTYQAAALWWMQQRHLSEVKGRYLVVKDTDWTAPLPPSALNVIFRRVRFFKAPAELVGRPVGARQGIWAERCLEIKRHPSSWCRYTKILPAMMNIVDEAEKEWL